MVTTDVPKAIQLGRFSVSQPLSVAFVPPRPGSGTWLALLLPGLLTGNEYGEGRTPEAALKDLESTIWEIKEYLQLQPDDILADELLAYKRVLAKYVVVNTTVETVA